MNRVNRADRAGFTLVEVLASAALAGISIVACMGAIAKMEHGESVARAREALINLTIQKYDEVVATSDLTQANSLAGDFTDRNDTGHKWSAAVQAISTTSSSSVVNTANAASNTTVDSLSVTVTSTTDPTQSYTVTGLVYVPASTTTTTPATGAAGAGGRTG